MAKDDTIKPISFQELLEKKPDEDAEHFVRFLSTGRLPTDKSVKIEPKVSTRELGKRKQEFLERDTFQRAFTAGEKAGMEMGEQKATILVRNMENLLKNIEALPAQIFQQSERFLVETAIVLVKEILGHELSVQPEDLIFRIQRILQEAGDRDKMVLHLHPEDAKFVNQISEYRAGMFKADAQVTRGAVVLHSAFGGIEDDPNARLKEVEEAIRGALSSRLDEIEQQTLSASVSPAATLVAKSAAPPVNKAGTQAFAPALSQSPPPSPPPPAAAPVMTAQERRMMRNANRNNAG